MNCGGIAYAYGNYTLERDVEVTKYISIGETTSFTIPYGIHFNINNPSLGGTIAKDVVRERFPSRMMLVLPELPLMELLQTTGKYPVRKSFLRTRYIIRWG